MQYRRKKNEAINERKVQEKLELTTRAGRHVGPASTHSESWPGAHPWIREISHL